MQKKLISRVSHFLFASLPIIYSSAVFSQPNGLYIGALLGAGDTSYSASNQNISPASKDKDTFAWRVYGGYQYNPNLGLEAGFIYWPETYFSGVAGTTRGNVDITQKSVDLLGKFSYPFNAAGSVYAEAGIGYVKANKSANAAAKAGGVGISSKNTIRPVVGLGVNYEFYPKTVVDAAWIRIPAGNGIETSNFLGIGVSFYIG